MKIVNKFKVAFEGLFYLIQKDRNFQIHLSLFALLIVFAIYFNINKLEWMSVLICSALVFSLEAINSALEKICDLKTKDFHPEIKKIKDIASAAVLIASLFSIAVAVVVFYDKI